MTSPPPSHRKLQWPALLGLLPRLIDEIDRTRHGFAGAEPFLARNGPVILEPVLQPFHLQRNYGGCVGGIAVQPQSWHGLVYRGGNGDRTQLFQASQVLQRGSLDLVGGEGQRFQREYLWL